MIEPGFYKTKILDPTALEERIRQSWRQAPVDVRDDYGEEFLNAGKTPSVCGTCTSLLAGHINQARPHR